MRTGLVVSSLAVVASVSALDLTLGGIWVVLVLVCAALRRRHRLWPTALLALTIAMGAVGAVSGWLGPPVPGSYADGPLGRLWDGNASSRGPLTPVEAARAEVARRLEERRREELGDLPRRLERRAALAVVLARRAQAVRPRAAGEVDALERAVQRLALTLTSAEFRDLEARRAGVTFRLARIEAVIAQARDQAEMREAAAALEPVALASVSMRALREDLATAEAAGRDLLQALAGRPVTVAATSGIVARHDEAAGRFAVERRVRLAAGGPFRFAWVDVAPLLDADEGGRGAPAVTVEVPGRSPASLGPGERALLADGAGEVVVTLRRWQPAPAQSLRPPLRLLTFRRVMVDLPPGPSRLLAGVTLPGWPDLEAPVVVEVPAGRLESLAAAPYALHHAARAGRIEAGREGDRWSAEAGPASPRTPGGTPARVEVEMVPRSWLVRNAAFAAVRPYVYGCSPATGLALTGLAALVVALVPARRAPDTPAA